MIRRVLNDLFSRESLKTQIEGSLVATLPDSSWEVRVSEIQIPVGVIIPPGGSVQVVPPITRPRGATNIEVRIVADGQTVRRVWIPCRVNDIAKVAVVLREITAQSHIEASDVKWEKRDVTNMMEIPTTESDLVGAVSKSNLVPGMILNRSLLEREMAMRFGETVDLTAGDDDFVITTKGIAQQNGFIGDIVRVKNVATNKVIDGVVTAPGTVRVRF